MEAQFDEVGGEACLRANDSEIWHDSETKAGCNKPAAYERAKAEVKRNLKSPSTAEFPPLPSGPLYSNGQVIISEGSAICQFRVSAWVDAQNGYGAMLRSNFTVTLTHNPTSDDWHINETSIAAR